MIATITPMMARTAATIPATLPHFSSVHFGGDSVYRRTTRSSFGTLTFRNRSGNIMSPMNDATQAPTRIQKGPKRGIARSEVENLEGNHMLATLMPAADSIMRPRKANSIASSHVDTSPIRGSFITELINPTLRLTVFLRGVAIDILQPSLRKLQGYGGPARKRAISGHEVNLLGLSDTLDALGGHCRH